MNPDSWTFQGTASSALHNLESVVSDLETVPGIHPSKVMAVERGGGKKKDPRLDKFAAHALAGILTHPQTNLYGSDGLFSSHEETRVAKHLDLAHRAWNIATWMLEVEEMEEE